MTMTLRAYSSSGKIELTLTMEEARSASHAGQCDVDVAALLRLPHVAAHVATWNAEILRCELREFGVWTDAELSAHADNCERMLWLLASDIVDLNLGPLADDVGDD